MPSFIYIARIKRISEELAQSLRSSGCHVKYFKPGEITGDGCLLAMTSEAADGASRPEGDRAGTDGKFAGMPPAPDMSEQLGVQAAVWNSLKTAVSNELGATPVETEAIKSGSTPAEVGQGGISGTQGKAAVEIAQIEPSQIPAVSSSEASPDPNRIRLAIAECYRFFRSPLSTVIALLVFSVAYRSLTSPIDYWPPGPSQGKLRHAI